MFFSPTKKAEEKVGWLTMSGDQNIIHSEEIAFDLCKQPRNA